MKDLCDEQIIESWKKNVSPWVAAIQNGEIGSRLTVTNRAILNAITVHKPKTVLDIGCGEGWLVRELVNSGIDVLGIDAIPEFIKYANEQGCGRFKTLAYENISSSALAGKFDVIVSNFSLLGEASVNHVFKQVPMLLNKGGAFIVQTIHPIAGCETGKYEDGWRKGSWTGFSEHFC
ncbi:MAG TPA: methyltransferase domain-containing protein, partial [Gammaproteobacteria bacterium]